MRGSFVARTLLGWLLATVAPLCSTNAQAEIGVEPPPIYNLYGEVGILDMPTARIAPDGAMSATFSADHTGEHYNLGFQLLPWLETTFRYSRIDRYELLFPATHQGDLYDRSLSVKIRLLRESEYQPSIVIGARDILGTGAYGGEYLAASKQFGDFDFTIGLGWRRLAGLESFPNPLGLLSSSFKNSGAGTTTGVPTLGDFFHGPDTGLFGGVKWQTPIEGLALVAELSGDSYKIEQAVGSIKINSRVNLGLSYEPIHGLEVGAGYLYGSEFAMRITLHMNAFDEPPTPRLGVQPLDPVIRPTQEQTDAVLGLLQSTTHFYDIRPGTPSPIQNAALDTNGLADHIFDSAAAHEFAVENIEMFGDSLILSVAGRKHDLPCSSFAQIQPSAQMSGIHQIALSFAGTSQVEVCNMNRARANPNAPARLYASIDNIASTDDGGNNDTQESMVAPPQPDENPDAVKKRIIKAAKSQNLAISAIQITATRIEVAFANGTYRSNDEAMGRLLRVLMAEAPYTVEVFRVVNMVDYVPTNAITISRSDIERTLNMYGAGSELTPLTKIVPVSEHDSLLTDNSVLKFPKFGYSISPGLNKSFFDPDNPLRIGVYMGFYGGVDLDRHLSISGSFQVNLYNTFNITRPADSALPHVRTDFAEYYKKGINGISSLQTAYFTKLAPEVYAYARAGYLEDMFGGLGGEVLWEPSGQRWALGAALYDVQQRQFDRLFGFRAYRVLTGHASLYYQSPFYDLNFELHVGRYLAGDYGATFQMTRRFDNGIEIGAYATLTNVPFSVFGEGSFDKGFIIEIPVENLEPVNTKSNFSLDFSPLTRDGGQRLVGEQTLYRYVQDASEGDLRANWDEVLRP
jgi:hypothetical protein